ncbi:hypothetical protein RCL1_001230 [Eukaryota sp. TZLM3-RCL]
MKLLLIALLLATLCLADEGQCVNGDSFSSCSVRINELVQKIYKIDATVRVDFAYNTTTGEGSVQAFVDDKLQAVRDLEIVTARHFCFFYMGASYCIAFEEGHYSNAGASATVSVEVHFVIDLGRFKMGKMTVGSVNDEFEAWLNNQNKLYSSAEELAYRRTVFFENKERIAQLAIENPEAEFELNEFADVTEQEFLARFAPITPPAKNEEYITCEAHLPERFDWREHGWTQPVKNQGSCGSCWAFSTISALEHQLFRKTGDMIELSEQQLVDCDRDFNQGCHGGLMIEAFDYIAKKTSGVMKASDYTYKAKDQTCQYKPELAVEETRVKAAHLVAKNEEEILKCLVSRGVLAIAVNASPLQFYSRGILNPLSCSPDRLSHAVTLIGYGEEKGKPYTVIRNSWGKSWGESGHFRMVRSKNTCGWQEYVAAVDLF